MTTIAHVTDEIKTNIKKLITDLTEKVTRQHQLIKNN